jgi:hypothetical protein
VLDDLDQVGWRDLRHAYGTAEDMPDLIRALANPSRDARSEVWHQLYGNIWHQGTIYEATPYAVPFLIELAASPQTPARFEILSYLGLLADGLSYVAQHKGLTGHSRELAEQLQTELHWVAQTRKAVKHGEALYLATLHTGEHKMCCAAAYVLTRFPEESARYWPGLRARYEDADDDGLVRCGLAILTNAFSMRGTSDIRWLGEMLMREKRRSVRVALAASISLTANPNQSDALKLLTANMFSDDEIDRDYRAQPWDAGEAAYDIVRGLCASPNGRRMLTLRFNELLSLKYSHEKLEHCRYLLQIVLGDENVGSDFFIGAPLKPLILRNEA